MSINSYNFMSIGGNCAYLALQKKEDRIRGPVDNVILNGVNAVKLLVENKYYDFIKNSKFEKIKRPPGHFEGDCDWFSVFPNNTVRLVHNLPEGEKFFKDLKLRCTNLTNFINKVRTDKTSYLILTLNQQFVEKGTGKFKNDEFFKILDYLAATQLLQKTIVVGSKWNGGPNKDFDFYIYDLVSARQKHKFMYIEIQNIEVWHPEKNQEQFKKEIIKLFNL